MSGSTSSLALHDLAERLHSAEQQRCPVAPITASHALSPDDAYRVQQLLIDRKLAADPADRWKGLKAGLTSRVKQEMAGIDEPILGQLLFSNLVDGHRLSLDRLIQPRVEPEVGFYFHEALEGEPANEEALLQAVGYAFPALEILDSRFQDYSFNIADVIADNASTARVVLGDRLFPVQRDRLASLGVSLSVNGQVCGTGTPTAVLGHPLASALWTVKKWARLGKSVPAGSLLLTGGVTAAVPIRPGDAVVARFGTWDTVFFHCV